MGKVILEDVHAENNATWKEMKRKTLGSSEIATVLGLNRFDTPLKLWARKTGRLDEEPENPHMKVGKYMEPLIAEFFGEREGVEVEQNTQLYQHDKYPFAVATPDYYVKKEGKRVGIVECKHTKARNIVFWLDGNIPNYAHCQLLWQLEVCTFGEGWIAGMCGADPESFFSPHVEYSGDIASQMLDKAAEFMDFVERDIPPGNPKADDVKVLERIFEPSADQMIELSDAYLSVLSEYKGIEQAMKQKQGEVNGLGKALKELRAQVLLAMGHASIAKAGPYTFTRKVTHRKGYWAKETQYETCSLKDESQQDEAEAAVGE